MKKIYIPLIACITLLASSCGPGMMGGSNSGNGSNLGNVLSGVLGSLGNQNTINSLLDLVIGKVKITQSQLVGNWKYTEPGCAFTSEKLLAQAGGAVAAGKVKEKLQPVYNSIGVKSSNTYFTFTADNKFQAKVCGLPLSGTYVLDENAGSLKLNATLISLTGYVTRTTHGMALTFESKKLMSVLQTLSAISGNSTIKTIGDLSSQFDGVRVGFELAQ